MRFTLTGAVLAAALLFAVCVGEARSASYDEANNDPDCIMMGDGGGNSNYPEDLIVYWTNKLYAFASKKWKIEPEVVGGMCVTSVLSAYANTDWTNSTLEVLSFVAEDYGVVWPPRRVSAGGAALVPIRPPRR